MKLNRNIAVTITTGQPNDESAVELSPSESVSFVWELTKEVFSLTKQYDVESRLQRDAIHIIRGRG